MSSEGTSNQETSARKFFTEQGVFSDEITVTFDDDERELFVSQNFLSMSSPMFEAMFSHDHDFIEKKEKKLPLPEQNYDDFLEFLMCIHPAIQKAVDESNVENILPIANEYQVPSVIEKCKAFMKTIADRDHERASGNLSGQIEAVRKCLIFLNIALNFEYQDISVYLADTLAKYPSPAYMEMDIDRDTRNYIERAHFDVVKEKDIPVQEFHKECLDLFAKLPTEVRLQVVSKRLQHQEDLRISQ